MFKTTKGRQLRPRIITIVGTGGIGKTTAAANIAKALGKPALFASYEVGSDDLDVERTELLTGEHADAFPHYYMSPDGRHYHGNVLVIDTIDAWQHVKEKQVADSYGVIDPKQVDYGKGKAAVEGHMRKVIETLLLLHRVTRSWLIILAHVDVTKVRDPMVGEYDKFAPRLYDDAADLLIDKSDEVLFLNYETSVIKEDAGFNRQRGRGVGTGERKMFTREMPGFYAKRRFPMPDELELPEQGSPYVDHLRAYYQAIQQEQKAAAEAAAQATAAPKAPAGDMVADVVKNGSSKPENQNHQPQEEQPAEA